MLLDPSKQKRIIRYLAEKRDITWIAHTVGCSRTTVYSMIGRKTVRYKPARSERHGVHRIITPALVRKAKNKIKTYQIRYARDLLVSLGLCCSIETGRRLLAAAGGPWRKQHRKPKLTPAHKELRITHSLANLALAPKIYRTVYVDEKRFEMDCPAHMLGARATTHPPAFVPQSNRPREGVMIFAGIGFNYKSDISVVSKTINQHNYWEMLQEDLFPSATRKYGKGWYLAQDNAPAHHGKWVREQIESSGVNLGVWPARSPDLNPIENLWGVLVFEVFRFRDSYDRKEDLEAAIVREWEKIKQETINNLIESVKDRSIEVIKAGGESTRY